MKKILLVLTLMISVFAVSTSAEAWSRGGGWYVGGGWSGGTTWRGGGWGGGVYVGYPGHYGYGPAPVYAPYAGPYVPYSAYQPYYGYYPYGPVPVATGAPFIYNR